MMAATNEMGTESVRRNKEISLRILKLHEQPSHEMIVELFEIIRDEVNSNSPNLIALRSQFPHFLKICQDLLDANEVKRLKSQDPQEVMDLTLSTVTVGKIAEDISELFSARVAQITGKATQHKGIEEKIDNTPAKEDDEAMSATTDKDYIDAKLEAMTASLNGRMELAAAKADERLNAAAAKSDERLNAMHAATDARMEAAAAKADARFEVSEARIDGRIQSIEQLMDKKFAEFDAALHKNNFDLVKWIVGTAIAVIAIATSLATFIMNNTTPKQAPVAPAPIVIYAQQAPATTTPQATAAPPAATTKP